jgi:hypothetical protein
MGGSRQLGFCFAALPAARRSNHYAGAADCCTGASAIHGEAQIAVGCRPSPGGLRDHGRRAAHRDPADPRPGRASRATRFYLDHDGSPRCCWRDDDQAGQGLVLCALASAEIRPHIREVASSEFSTTTRPSHRSKSSRVRDPQLRVVAHCHSSPTVTNVTHHAMPATLAAIGSPSLPLIARDATSVSRTT